MSGEVYGTIKALLRYPKRKEPGIAEKELHLEEGAGICGDCHADGGDRQISLLTIEIKEWMEQQGDEGICFKKYKENLLMEGIELGKCRPGDQLICGQAVLELSDSVKKCYPDSCELARLKENCMLFGCRVCFAKVKKGGVIRLGMPVFRVSSEKSKTVYR